MTQRNKLELQLNKPTQIELLYDEPVTGESNYGKYYLYAVKSGNQEFSYFAPEEVHEELQNFSKGDKVVVTKSAVQNGKKVLTKYSVTMPGVGKLDKPNFEQKPITLDSEEKPNPETKQGKVDNYFNIMLQCYSDALEIQNQLGSMIDTSRIAITLFIARSKTNGNLIRSEAL